MQSLGLGLPLGPHAVLLACVGGLANISVRLSQFPAMFSIHMYMSNHCDL